MFPSLVYLRLDFSTPKPKALKKDSKPAKILKGANVPLVELVHVPREKFHGPIGDGRIHLCTDSKCNTKGHATNRKNFPFEPGFFMQVTEGRVLAKPTVSNRDARIYNAVLKKAFAGGAPKDVIAGLLHTINELEKTNMSDENKLRDVESYLESMLRQGGSSFSDTAYDLSKASMTPQKLPKAESIIKSGATTFPDEKEDAHMTLDDDAIAEELEDDAKQSDLYHGKMMMEMLRDMNAQARLASAKIGEMATMETPLVDMVRSLQDQMQDVTEDVEEIQAELDKANKTIGSQATTIDAMQKQIDDLTKQSQSHTTDINAIVATVNQFMEIVEDLNKAAGKSMVRSADTSELEKQLAELQTKVASSDSRMTNLEDEMASSNVKLISLGGDSVSFQTEAELKVFVDPCTPDIADVFSTDMLVMLALIRPPTVETEEMQQSELHAAKVQRTQTQTIHAAAYLSNYPAMLVGKNQTDLQTGRILFHAIRTYPLFNKNNGREGIANVIRKNLPNARRKLELQIDQKLPGPQLMEQRMLAKYLVAKSCDFILSLLQFMERMRLELLTHGHGDGPYSAAAESQVWELVLLMLAACLDCLYEPRCEASQGYLDPATSNFVYLKAALNTHMEMERFVATNFSEHPSIAPKLQRYIFETFVSKTDFEELKGTVNVLKRSFDSFVSQSRGGGGGGGGGDDLSVAQKRKLKKQAAKAKEDAEE